VQNKAGDDDRFVGTAHGLQAAVGGLSTLLICIFAHPMAYILNVGENVWGVYLLAPIPLLNGLLNLENKRQCRHMRFAPVVWMEVIPQVLTTALTWPLAVWLNDFRAILWVLLAKAILHTTVSHLLAKGRYPLAIDRAHLGSIVRFGYPLVLSSVILFANFQGDRFVIASFYTPADLAVYAVAATLAMTPVAALLRIMSAVTLPLLAKAQDDARTFSRRYALAADLLGWAAGLFGLGVLIAGESFVTLVFGAKYAGSGTIAGLLAVSQALRLVRAGPTAASMARGDTVNTLMANWVRLTGLGLATAAAYAGLNLIIIAWTMVAGEALAMGTATWRLRRVHGLPMSHSFKPVGVGILFWLFALGGQRWFVPGSHPILDFGAALAACLAYTIVMLILFQELRSFVLPMLNSLSRRFVPSGRAVPAR
jgi:O-antigen/teichoic acid export membrane protein